MDEIIAYLRKPSHFALFMGVVYWILALGFAWVNPLFEAPDEHHHFFTAVAIAETKRLPIAEENLARQEAAQPPLYYVLGAFLIAPFQVETAVAAADLWFNPYAQLGVSTYPANRNAFIVLEPSPVEGWANHMTAAYLLRLFSISLGSISLWAIYQAGRVAWPTRPWRAVISLAVVASLPQFIFLHSAITNDALIICCASLVLWQMMSLWRGGLVTHGRLLWLGLLCGAALLTKMTGLLLMVWVIGGLLWLAWRPAWAETPNEQTQVKATAVFLYTLTPALLLSGWLLIRNWLLYGDPTAANMFIEFGGGDRQYTIAQGTAELGRVWQSTFAFFGWMTIQPPRWVYLIWNMLVVVGVLGLLLTELAAWRQRGEETGWRYLARYQIPLWLLGWVGLVAASWFQFLLRTPADQGRLLFPALLPLALGLGYGLSRWEWGAGVVWGVGVATAVFSLVQVIPVAYARPVILTELPTTAVPLTATWADIGVELVGIELPDTAVVAGGRVELTLYWQLSGAAPPADAPLMVVEILGRELVSVGKLHSYHGRGLYPANLWPVEGIVVDEVVVQLDAETAVPVEARLWVTLLSGGEQVEPQLGVEVGRVKVVPTQWVGGAENTAVVQAQFGAGIQLQQASIQSASPRQGSDLHLHWHITTPPQDDLNLFIHLGNPTEPPLFQADGPPLGGFYPTHLWATGEKFTDIIHLPWLSSEKVLPAPLYLGFYNLASGERLVVTVAGEPQPFHAYQLAAPSE